MDTTPAATTKHNYLNRLVLRKDIASSTCYLSAVKLTWPHITEGFTTWWKNSCLLGSEYLRCPPAYYLKNRRSQAWNRQIRTKKQSINSTPSTERQDQKRVIGVLQSWAAKNEKEERIKSQNQRRNSDQAARTFFQGNKNVRYASWSKIWIFSSTVYLLSYIFLAQ